MAIVAAVVDVVGPVHSREDLQQKSGLVRTSPTEIPEAFVCRDSLQPTDDLLECFVPRDRLVIIVAASVQHRLSQATAVFQFSR